MIFNDSNYELLLPGGPVKQYGAPGAFPRTTRCGTRQALKLGLVPAAEGIEPIPQADWKEVIAECHAKKLFAMYHRKASKVLEQKPSQNGLNFCWGWGIEAALENCRRLEGQADVLLRAVSLGWLVDWRNAGNYLDQTIAGVNQRGIASAAFVPDQYSRSPSSYKSGWEADALNYRTSEWWDGNRGAGTISTIGQSLAMLRTGRTLYSALNWWGHALGIEGMEWDESQTNNIVWDYFNSHGDGSIQLAGSRGVPDEFYSPRASSLPA